ncbi:MAG: YqcC family protein [Gammaproteobacteria bacterium]|nr:YqcC family protein [Gammaproteobacteria bacterium]
MRTYARVTQVLDLLETALCEQGLWTALPPTPAAMASRMPFCCDTMSLQAWLQWQLVPRLRAIVEAQGPLPARSAIAPYAEVRWPQSPPYLALVALLRDLDATLEGGGVR